MDHSYRITKYRYLSFGGKLRSSASEWTSFSQFDDADDLRMQEYLSIEDEYVSLAMHLCNSFCAGSLRIQGLERLQNIGGGIYEGAVVSIAELPELIRSILREEF